MLLLPKSDVLMAKRWSAEAVDRDKHYIYVEINKLFAAALGALSYDLINVHLKRRTVKTYLHD